MTIKNGFRGVEGVMIMVESSLDNTIQASGKILYIEDDLASLKLMQGIIRRSDGLSLLSAHNAELGLGMARTLDPDMIILDINLPGINRLQALETLKKMQIVPRIPVIALSAAKTRKDIKKGLDAGFQEYLTKPVDLHEVLGVTNKLLRPNSRVSQGVSTPLLCRFLF